MGDIGCAEAKEVGQTFDNVGTAKDIYISRTSREAKKSPIYVNDFPGIPSERCESLSELSIIGQRCLERDCRCNPCLCHTPPMTRAWERKSVAQDVPNGLESGRLAKEIWWLAASLAVFTVGSWAHDWDTVAATNALLTLSLRETERTRDDTLEAGQQQCRVSRNGTRR